MASKMNSVDKVTSLITLVEELESCLGDGVISCNVSALGSRVLLTSKAFLATFQNYNMELLEREDFKRYELSSQLGNVLYIALIDFSGIVALKTSMPSEWEYMQRKIQLE